MKDHVILVDWCEIDGKANASRTSTQNNKELILPQTASEEEVIQFLRDENDEMPDDDGDYHWRVDSYGRTKNCATVEFRSGHGHLSVITLIWF